MPVAKKKPTHKTPAKALIGMGACPEAVRFVKKFKTLGAAWKVCNQPSWMFWYIGRTTRSAPWSEERKPLVACALDCAETVKHLWPAVTKDQIANAIGVMRQWIAGKATVEQAQAARQELWSCWRAAAAYAAAAAADAAADAAAAAYAAAADARSEIRKQCCDIIRRHYPRPPKA